MSSSSEQAGEISTPNVLKLSSDLRPLMFWMSNATELLNFFQVKVETMEREWEFEGDLETAHFETVPPRQDGFFDKIKEHFRRNGRKCFISCNDCLYKPPGIQFSQLTWTPAQKHWHSWMMS